MKKSSSSFNFSNNTNKNKKTLSKHHHHHHVRDENKNLHALNDKNYEKWEKFRDKKLDMMRSSHKQNVERQLRHEYNNQNYNDPLLHHNHPRRKVAMPPTGRSLTDYII